MYNLNSKEQKRLIDGIQAAYAIPFIHDITDFIWEAIFAYTKNIPIRDPLIHTRKKLLFDVVDQEQAIGWSAKAVQKSLNPPTEFELVIQRADIFKKSRALGFEALNLNSKPQHLGEALLKHWYDKVFSDSKTQGVQDNRICVLLKSLDRRHFAFFEDELAIYDNRQLKWIWTNETRTGLQGIRISDGFCVFRWYPNQKQLFERFYLPTETLIFPLNLHRLAPDQVVSLLLNQLNKL